MNLVIFAKKPVVALLIKQKGRISWLNAHQWRHNLSPKRFFPSRNFSLVATLNISVHFSDLDSVNIRLKLKTWWMKYSFDQVANIFIEQIIKFNETDISKRTKRNSNSW